MDHPFISLENLYAEVGPALLAYFRRETPLRPIAEDLFQETFSRAMQQLHRLKHSVSPRAYLFGIARNLRVDALRHARRSESLTWEPAVDANPENPRLEALRLAISQLPPDQQEVLRLKLESDLSYQEISDVVGIPVGTVRSRLHYAVEKLRGVLRADSGSDAIIHR
jgi:RNA polymerase sigma-70 factor (ECF subfamily)